MMNAISLVPDALRPSWMRATWEGTHGTAGIHANLDTTTAELVLREDGLIGSGSALGAIVVPDSTQAGRIHRTMNLASTGQLTVSHNLLTVPEAAQGSGFARSLNDHAFARYADAGVDSVNIHAALSVGGYAWARQGFELNVPTGVVGAAADRVRGEKLTAIVDSALRGNRMTQAQYDSIADRLVRPREDMPSNPLVRIGDLAALPEIGPAALLRSDWHGARPIETTRPWWGAAHDASSGASQLSDSTRLGSASVDRARAIDATLPDMFQMASRSLFERAMSGTGTSVDDAVAGATSAAKMAVGDDGLTARETKHVINLADDRTLNVHVSIGRLGEPIGGQFVSKGDVRSRQAAIDDAWRAIGITTVNDASYNPPVRRLG